MRTGTHFYTTILFVRAKKLCGASLHWYIPIAQRIVDALLYRIPLWVFTHVVISETSAPVYLGTLVRYTIVELAYVIN